MKKKYVDNDELGRLVELYIRSNPNDRGEWLDKYERTMTNRNKGKNDKKLNDALDFIGYRKSMYAGERPYDQYEKTCSVLIPMVYKIIDGRMASYKMFGDEDIRQDCMLAVLKYINRYDWRKKTSALAYLTEIITNAINLHLQEKKKDYLEGNIILESDMLDTRSVDEFKGIAYED